ncbi:hypothetical protein LCGC14_1787920, partial [marine sediment metagenome]
PWWDQMIREQAAYFRLAGQQRAANLMIDRASANPEWMARFMTRVEGPIKGVGAAEDLVPFQEVGGRRLIRKLVDEAPEDVTGQLSLEAPPRQSGSARGMRESGSATGDEIFKGAERRAISGLQRRAQDIVHTGERRSGGVGRRAGEEGFDIARLEAGVKPSGPAFTPPDELQGLGKPRQVSEFWQIEDDVLWRDIERMGPMGQNLVASFIGLPAQVLRTSATSSFEFLTKNPIRDLTFAFVNSGVNPMAFTRGMASILKQDDAYVTWLQAGGSRAALTGQARNDIAQATRLIDQGKMSALSNVVAHPLEAMFKLSEFLENSTRVGAFNAEFGRLMKEGLLDPTEAALTAAKFSREASVDFGMAGSYAWMSNFRITTAFFNAALQGTDQIVRSMARDPIGTSTRMFAAITVPSVALYMINRKDPEYRELPPWERDLFWHVKRGTGVIGQALGDDPGPEDDLWIRIPKPFEPGLLAGTMVEKFLESIDERDPLALDEQSGEVLRQVLAGYLPIPTAVVPLLENMGNQDAITGRPIIPRGLEDVDPSLQRNKATSAVSIALANFINGDDISEGKISPLHIDNVVNGYAGGLGMTLWRDAGNILIRGTRRMRGEASAMGPAPARDFLQMSPGLRGLVSNYPFGSRSVEEMYDLAERARVASRTASYLKNSLAVQDYAEWVEKHASLIAVEPITRRALEQLGALRDQRNLVDEAQDMDPEAKRLAIYQIDQGMMKQAAAIVKALKAQGIRPQGQATLLGRAAETLISSPGL